jgi:hypothetical protein
VWLTWCHTGWQMDFFQKTAKIRPKSKIGDHHTIFTDLRDFDKSVDVVHESLTGLTIVLLVM